MTKKAAKSRKPTPQPGVRADIGEHLRRARLAHPLSIEQAARELGISRPHLANVERGIKRPSVELLRAATRLYSLAPDVPQGADSLSITRSHLAHCYDYAVDEFHERLLIDRDGNATIARSLRGVRPTRSDEPLEELSFKTRVVGQVPSNRRTWISVTGETGKVGYDITSQVRPSGDIIHAIRFPGGWSRQDGGAIQVEFEDYLGGAYALRRTPENVLGRFNQAIPYLVERFCLEIELPEGYRPQEARIEGRFGLPDFRRCAAGAGVVCRTATITVEDHRIEVIVEAPLPASWYSAIWEPDPAWMSK